MAQRRNVLLAFAIFVPSVQSLAPATFSSRYTQRLTFTPSNLQLFGFNNDVEDPQTSSSSYDTVSTATTEIAMFDKDDFGGVDSDWLSVPGVTEASVGYTGSRSPAPTYQSVCGGDGHTEAVRLEFNPRVLRYEDLIRRFIDDPRVPNIYGRQEPQYQVAIWVSSSEQGEIAQRVCSEVGKDIPVLEAMEWFDAESNHQNFFGPPENFSI
eukprot:CAMPEP_0194402304 /NCGR_PEP_ID=MMETSP0176-20130528/993_1 /TAXON_ID=216777 /ORGANISM="Proboscia alata, Strain PI-D3" /LENGTH=209 /DNA_ID=CAMNT_0039199553 /DNA_START=25 /DNA_END=654 /DNA_ORIENTATION=+